jgi:hypothetical protein
MATSTSSVISLFYQRGRRGRYSRNFATDVFKMMPAVWRCGFQSGPGRFAEKDVKTSAEITKRGSELGGGGGRMNWICMWIGASTSFTSVASAGPILVAFPVNNTATIPRTFASLQRSAIRSQGREIPRAIAFSESIRRGKQRPGFRPNRGVQIVRSLHPMLCEDAIGGARRAEFAVHDLGFLWAVNPKNRPRRRD